MDGPRNYHMKWSVLERQMLYDDLYKWTYLKSRNRLTDKKRNKLMVTKGDRGGGEHGEMN